MGHFPWIRMAPVAASGSLLLLAACGGGSASAETRIGGDVQVFDFDRPLAEDELAEEQGSKPIERRRALSSVAQQEEAAATTGQHALLGARHDLRLAASVTQARCQCLGVALGPPTDPALAWEGTPPSVHPTRQIVMAFSSEGIPCANNPEGQTASYRGYRVEGGDVIVTVEIAQAGRPVTRGAILPRPEGTGGVYMEPRDRSVPFGRALEGGPRCALGE